MKYILTYCFFVLALTSLAGPNPLTDGNDSYEAGNYQDAIDSYGSIIAEGNHSAELYYNLGNSHYRNGEIGKAIWAYESALKIEPDHEDALFNLSFANAQTADKIDTDRHGFGHWLQSLAFSSQINLWAFISIGGSLLFSIFGIVFISTKNKRNKNLSLLASSILGLVMLAGIVLAYMHKDFITSRAEGVIISEQVKILISPIEDAKSSYTLSEGAKVELISEEKEWVQINLNGNIGWLLKEHLWEL